MREAGSVQHMHHLYVCASHQSLYIQPSTRMLLLSGFLF
jgi:hypothetical protein